MTARKRKRKLPEPEPVDLDQLLEHGRALREAASGLRDAAQNAVADAEAIARSGVKTHPYATLGAVFAAGWVLGGGLPTRFAGLATSALGRAAFSLAVARLADARLTEAEAEK